jgi:hypothetical protein
MRDEGDLLLPRHVANMERRLVALRIFDGLAHAVDVGMDGNGFLEHEDVLEQPVLEHV